MGDSTRQRRPRRGPGQSVLVLERKNIAISRRKPHALPAATPVVSTHSTRRESTAALHGWSTRRVAAVDPTFQIPKDRRLRYGRHHQVIKQLVFMWLPLQAQIWLCPIRPLHYHSFKCRRFHFAKCAMVLSQPIFISGTELSNTASV